MEKAAARFITRWFVSGLGLWIAAGLLGSGSINYGNRLGAIVIAGFVLAIVNTIIRPIVIFMTLPALLVTIGLFMVVINALMVLLASKLYSGLDVTNFWAAAFAGVVIGLVNYLVTAILEGNKQS